MHLRDNDNLPNPADLNRDCLFKVRKLTDMANKTFLAKYKLAREISIDETMVPFKGRSCLREYIPIKPIKCGMKVWRAAEADTGYLLQFDVYCGKRQDGTQRGLGCDVVMKLARPFLGRYHHPYFDKTNSLGCPHDWTSTREDIPSLSVPGRHHQTTMQLIHKLEADSREK